MEDSIIVGLILMIVGGLQALKTDWFVRFQIWIQKKLMGADYVPSTRTYTIVRIFGAVIMLMGLSIIIWGE